MSPPASWRLAQKLAGLICLALIGVFPGPSDVRAEFLQAESFKGNPPIETASNLVAIASGSTVIDLQTGATAARLIDGKPADGWLGSEQFDESSPVELMIQLGAPAMTRAVTDILIQPRHWQRGARAPETLEILISDDAAGGEFISVGTFSLAKVPGWQRLSIEAQVVARMKLRILSVHGVGRPGIGEVAVFSGLSVSATATNQGVRSPEAEMVEQTGGEIEGLEKVASNEVLQLGLFGYSTSSTYLGVTAPSSTKFLVLRGSIENLSTEKPLSLPAVEEMFSLSLGPRGFVQPHEVNRLGAYPFAGPVVIQPDARRAFALAFAAPDPLPEETALILSGTTARALDLPLFRQVTGSSVAAVPIAEAVTSTLRIAVTGIQRVPTVGNVTAPQGRQFAVVDLDVERLANTAITQTLADDLILVEDGQYVHPRHDATSVLGSHFTSEQRYNPGVVASGRLAFLVSQHTGDLVLVHFTPDGPSMLDLTPELEPAVKPQPVAGPSTEGLISVKLLGATQDEDAAETDKRRVTLDIELTLQADHWDQTFGIDPDEVLMLQDDQGRTYWPIRDAARLRRPLRTMELRRDQPVRGNVAFQVAMDADGFTLVIPLIGAPTKLALPGELLPAPFTQPDAPLTTTTPMAETPTTGTEAATPNNVCVATASAEPTQAVFLAEDDETRGNWQGTYGGQGHLLLHFEPDGQDLSKLPDHIGSFTLENAHGYVWSADTSDPRALASPSGNRAATTVYADESFSLTLNANDSRPHTLALYFLDWDTGVRVQNVTVYDAVTDMILDKRTLTDFHGGVYLLYEVQGSVRIEIVRTGEWDAVLSGVFWDVLSLADKTDVVAAIDKVHKREEEEASFTVRRGGETFFLTVASGNSLVDVATVDEERSTTLEEVATDGLTGRYLEGPGYGQLIVERRDPTVDFTWWRGPIDIFPEADDPNTGTMLWAEWEGDLMVRGSRDHNVILLAGGQSPGFSFGASDAVACVTSVDKGSPADAAGLQVGDVFSRSLNGFREVGTHIELGFRIDAPLGGHLFVDGIRWLANIPCGEVGLTECQRAPKLEGSHKVKPGNHRIRVASIFRSQALPQAEIEEEVPAAPTGPSLYLRRSHTNEFQPVAPQTLSAVPTPGRWSRTPRQAAQMGLEWLQSAALDWQNEHQCYGCHVQSQALSAMAIAGDNEYRVSHRAYTELLDGLASYQRDDGAWHDEFLNSATQFGAFALATVHERGNENNAGDLLEAVEFLLQVQDDDGRIPINQVELPIAQGDILSTANATIAFSVAESAATPALGARIREATGKALIWLADAVPITNQDRAMKVLGLAANPDHREALRDAIAAAKTDLIGHQLDDGGWGESEDFQSNAFATGQALYALKVSGQSVASEPFQRGVDWLLGHQLWTGAWPQTNTASGHASQYAPTMWPVIALVGSFKAVGVEIVQPITDSCIEGDVELAARVVTDKPIDQVRFSVDGQEIGASRVATSDGLHRVLWKSDAVQDGRHELRVEALKGDATRGEDQTTILIDTSGNKCSGALALVSTVEPIPGVAAPNIELVLDASGSMKSSRHLIDGRLKIEVAKEVITEFVEGLPDGVNVGLRVYGQIFPPKHALTCTDSVLVVPITSIDKPRLLNEVWNVQANGDTPIAYSLEEAARDLAVLVD